jgi:hypothetical protein
LAELDKQEKHGKRIDTTSQSRRINEIPPVHTMGLDLRALYARHIDGAFVPKAKTKVLHVLIQFPKDLVDLDDAEGLLHHARALGERIWGYDAIFADRYDRDERSKGVVDLFVAPKYFKTTRTDPVGRLAVSMTRRNKALAKKYGRDPNKVWDVGKSLQDELYAYLRDAMGLEGVERGSPKVFAGDDWKSAEQLRVEELDAKEAQIESHAAARYAEAEAAGRAAGYAAGLEHGRAKVKDEEEAARRATEAAEEYNRETQRVRDAAIEARRQAELDRDAAKQAKESARAEGKREGLAAAKQELLDREIAVKGNEQRIKDHTANLERRESAFATVKQSNDVRAAELDERAKKIEAIEFGIEAFAVGDIVRAATNDRGARILHYKDQAARERWHEKIRPAFKEVWTFVRASLERLIKREKEFEAGFQRREAALAAAEADQAIIEGVLSGELTVGANRDGQRAFIFGNVESQKLWRPRIEAAGEKTLAFVNHVGNRLRQVDAQVTRLEKLLEPIKKLRKDYDSANEIARQAMMANSATAARLAAAHNPAIEDAEAEIALHQAFLSRQRGIGF